MSKYKRFSARASLAVVGIRMQQKGIWKTVEKHVQIKQKVINHNPLDKLKDARINILAGGQGLVEINTRVRPDKGLQRAFERESCAEQSVVSETINKCTEETVEQMQQAMKEIHQIHSQSYGHNYEQQSLLLDVDMSGMPAGRQGEGVTKGYFPGQKNRRGRQLGRVIATLYDEIIAERLYSGKRQLDKSLPELVTAAIDVLGLVEEKRQQTILRVDAGGGTDEDINWMLNQGFQVLVKVKNWKRSAKLARSVATWYPDPKVEGREVGWVEEPHQYDRPTRQLAIRHQKDNGEWSYHVLVFTLNNDRIFWLARQPVRNEPTSVLFAVLAAYDLRSGGIETSNKGSKQGLGLTKRNKRLFSAQEMLVLLAHLAYNLITWTRNTLASTDKQFARFGVLRIVRDLFHIPGRIELDAQGYVIQIALRANQPGAPAVVQALSCDNLSLILDEI